MNKLHSLFVEYRWIILAGLLIILLVWLITSILNLADQRSAAQNAQELHRLAQQRLAYDKSAVLNGKLAQLNSDSTKAWEDKYTHLDSLQKDKLHHSTQAHEDYKKLLATDSADAARLRFLAKRFPNLYPQASF
jgi:type II secretory pathway pseudopilin PulG